MTLTSREKVAYVAIATPATILVAYLLYCGIAVPLDINTQHLRYNPLESFEMYTLAISVWNKYTMDTNGISIITYNQQKSYQYQYYLGLFQEENVTVSNDSIHGNVSQKSWEEFTNMIDDNPPSTLFIAQWSQTECGSFLSCFEDNFPTESHFIYTPILKEHFMNVNSKAISDAFDETRDVATGAVLVILSGILILLLISIPSFDNNPAYFLFGILFIGAYFCWLFSLSVIPILFSTPYNMDATYWTEVHHSLAFTVGEYNPVWWVSGVMVNGIWMYSLLFFCPALCAVFCFVASCSCWCEIFSDEQKAEDISLGILISFVGIVTLGIIGLNIAFVVIFIANLTHWDQTTFNSLDNEHVLKCFFALICIWILFPALGCVVTAIGKKHNLRIESINSLKESITSMRSKTIRSTSSAGKYDTVQEDRETIAMTEETQHILQA